MVKLIIFFIFLFSQFGCTASEAKKIEDVCPLVAIKDGENKIINESQFRELRSVKPSSCKNFNGVLGQYKGVTLSAFYRCEDLCPENEGIYFTFHADQKECEKIGGNQRPIYNLFSGENNGYICEPKWTE